MSDRSKLRPNNHFLAYEAAEAACMEKYPKIQECMDISNVNVNMKECKHQLERFQECFNVHKPVAFVKLGQQKQQE